MVIPQPASGVGSKVRVLAMTSDNRLPAFPTGPTMKELGFPDQAPRVWYAFLAPAGTSAEVLSCYLVKGELARWKKITQENRITSLD